MISSMSGGSVPAINLNDNEQLLVRLSEKSTGKYIPAYYGAQVFDNRAYGAVRGAGNDAWAEILTSLNTIAGWLREMLGGDVATTEKTTVVPDLSPDYSRKNSEKPKDVLGGFTATKSSFGENFDVSTHATVIKMMMLKFGQSPADVFDEVKRSAGGYDITMKDGFSVHVAHDELARAAQASRFGGNDQGAIQDASFIFAAFVKRKQMKASDAGASIHFDEALEKTLSGEFPKRVLEEMGMTGFMQYVPSSLMQGKGTVGLLHTYNKSAALVMDGVEYNYQSREKLRDTYGYRLTGDETLSNEVLVNPAKETVQVSSVPVGVKPVDIWSGFYQGMEGNCVTVSAMKAAMMKLGQNPAGIYKHISATDDGYGVVMRDGFSLRVTYEELKKAEQGSNLKGTDAALLKDANFLYAVSAKRAQLENHEFRAAQSFEVAMETLNDGEMPGDAFRRLGLYAYTRPSTAQELAAGALGTLANYQHSVVVINGAMDFYGFKSPLASSSWDRNDGVAIKLV